jgi:hypothetical protein
VIPQTLVSIENFSESQRPGALYHAKFRWINNQKTSFVAFIEQELCDRPISDPPTSEYIVRDLNPRWGHGAKRAQCSFTTIAITDFFTG